MSIIVEFGPANSSLSMRDRQLGRGQSPRKVAPLSSSDDMDPARGVITAALMGIACWILAIMAFL